MKFIEDFVAYHKDFTGCPETFVRWSALYALSCVAGSGHFLRSGNWNHRPNLWILLSGDSSTYKSTALRTVRRMIADIDPSIQAAQQYSEAALIVDISENPHRCFFYDEAESYLKMLGEKFNQQMRSTFMTLFSGDDIIARRIQGKDGKGEYHETKVMRDGREMLPYICWSGASTPYQVGSHLNGSTTDMLSGFFPRILLIPQLEKGFSIPRPPPHDMLKYISLRDRLSVLYAIKEREYKYSETAGAIHDQWYFRITKRIEKADSLLVPFYLKMREIYVNKIAILSAFERQSSIIEDEDISNSIEWLWPIEKSWADTLSKFTEKEWDRESKRVMDFVKDNLKVTRSDVLKGVKGIRAHKLTAILDGLSQDDLIKVKTDHASDKPKTSITWNA